jgi:hypothetical protein
MTGRRAIGPSRRQLEIERMVRYMHSTEYDDHVRMRAARRAVIEADLAEIRRAMRCLVTMSRRASKHGGVWYYGDAGRAEVRVASAAAAFARRCHAIVDADIEPAEYLPADIVALLDQGGSAGSMLAATGDNGAQFEPVPVPRETKPENAPPTPDTAA